MNISRPLPSSCREKLKNPAPGALSAAGVFFSSYPAQAQHIITDANRNFVVGKQ